MEERELTLLEKLTEKFTKANMYTLLLAFEKGELDISMVDIISAVKPQKGGGASANPSKEIDGVMYHYCRYRQDYLPESQINMSQGKSKGSGILESKIAYRISKAADALKAEAMELLLAGNYEEGAAKNKEQDELRATIELAETFTDEAMANSIYHPDFGKKKEEAAETADII